jgi:YHS domain-containing protein
LPGASEAAVWDPRCATAALSACESSAEAPALEGTDVVEYFRSGERFQGSPLHASAFGKSTFYFRSGENKAVFDSAPESFAPRVGGFCAFQFSGADTESHLVELCALATDVVDEDSFYVFEGELLRRRGGYLGDLVGCSHGGCGVPYVYGITYNR